MKFALFACLLYSNLVIGQIKPNVEALENESWEVWQENVPISGGVRVGLMFNEIKSNFNPSQFFVYIPNYVAKNICIELSSKDGRYSAKLDYEVSKSIKGIQEFYLPTKYKKELLDYKSDEVVILASSGSTCDEGPISYLLSSWSGSPSLSTISLYVNSPMETTLMVNTSNGNSIEFPCSSVDYPNIAYNKKCSASFDSLDTDITLYIKQRVRKMGRVKFNSYEVPIKFADIED